jgi:nucleoside-diphosphate kinase
MTERSLLIVKPDGVQRRLIGRILQRFEDAGLKLHGMRLERPALARVEEHYAEHRGKPFFPNITSYLASAPVLVFVLGGAGAIARIRQLVGATCPAEAAPGTIRGDFAHMTRESGKDRPIFNLIHASANAADAEREIALWFKPEELVDYDQPDDYLHGR